MNWLNLIGSFSAGALVDLSVFDLLPLLNTQQQQHHERGAKENT